MPSKQTNKRIKRIIQVKRFLEVNILHNLNRLLCVENWWTCHLVCRLNSAKTDSSVEEAQEAAQPLVVIDERCDCFFVARVRKSKV